MGGMNRVERYIFRQAAASFLASLAILTTLVWLTQALRNFDLMTSQGQTVVIFMIITSLALPTLIIVIAPFALFLSAMWTLNRLNSDSELVVMSSAGLSNMSLARPFMILAVGTALLIGFATIYAQPASLRELRYWLTQVRADLISKIVREGQFTTVEGGLTFHVRERLSNGTLLGIFVQDARASDETFTYIAERGQIVDSNPGTFLVLEKGSVQRQRIDGNGDAAIVVFERYAFDLSQFTAEQNVTSYKPRERYTSELLTTAPDDPQYVAAPGRFRSELTDRFVAPLYPVAFMLIALASLGQARTTRQGRGVAIATAIACVVALRVAGFAALSASVQSVAGTVLSFFLPLAAGAIALAVIAGWIRPTVPRAVTDLLSEIQSRAGRLGNAAS